MIGDLQRGLAGLAAGLLCGGAGLWAGLRLARRNRGVDERLKLAAVHGLAQGWAVTGVALVAAFVWAAVGRPPVVEVVAGIYLVHLAAGAGLFVWRAARM